MRLSQLSLLLQEIIGDAFGFRRFWVVAQVSNHSYYAQKGFHYFDLIETEAASGRGKGTLVAKIPAVAWTQGAARIRDFEVATGQRFTNDIEVLVEVTVDFHPVYGLKLTLQDLDARFTLGQLEQQKQLTIDRLLLEHPDEVWMMEGRLVSFNQELVMPPVVQRIAVISSRTAAGYEDFLHSLEHNAFGYQFEIDSYFTTVQGEQHAGALAETMDQVADIAYDKGLDYDAVVVIRGGGASTDLLIFDQYEVARAIASCPFPVITGIGHQKNETLADLLAHTPLKTPTKVAEFIVQRNRSFEQSIISLQQSLVIRSQQFIASAKAELEQLKTALVLDAKQALSQEGSRLQQLRTSVSRQPLVLLSKNSGALQQQVVQLTANQKNYLQRQQQSIEHFQRLFRMASPEKVLQRGFAIIEHKGKIISNADAVDIDDDLTIILSGTALAATVHDKTKYNGSSFDL